MATPVVKVFPDLDALSAEAASEFKRMAENSVRQRGRFTVAVPGGSTPERFFRLLADKGYKNIIPWEHVHIFWGDERCVPPDHKESNFGQARRLFLSRVNIPSSNIHRIAGEIPAADAADMYEEVLKSEIGPAPAIDLVILGMGEDGHTASLFPGSPALWDKGRLVLPVFEKSPQRVTLSVSAINRSRRVIFLVSGSSKAAALSNILDATPAGKSLPAGRVKRSISTWLVDEAAAPRINTPR